MKSGICIGMIAVCLMGMITALPYVVAASPDLIPQKVTASCPFYWDDYNGKVYFKVKNQGDANAGGFYVKIRSLNDLHRTINVGYKYISGLNAGSYTVDFASVPYSDQAVSIESTVDYYNSVSESNEGNNVMEDGWCLGTYP